MDTCREFLLTFSEIEAGIHYFVATINTLQDELVGALVRGGPPAENSLYERMEPPP